MSKPKEYYDENSKIIILKAKRSGITERFNNFVHSHYTSKGIPKFLPRKQKKSRFGTRGNRHHLAIFLMENKKLLNNIINLTHDKSKSNSRF